MKPKVTWPKAFFVVGVVLTGCAIFLASPMSTKPDRTDKVLAASLRQPPANQASAQQTQPPLDNTAKYDAELRALIDHWVQSQPASEQWAVAAKGLAGTNVQADYQGSKVFESASMYKLFMIYALSQKVPQDQWPKQLPGDGRTISQCVDAMLIRSDNFCGDAMGVWLGWSNAQVIVRQAGYSSTTLNLSPVRTSANDTLKFMADLYNGVTFGPELQQRIINDLQQSVYRKGIMAGCPDCTVANKTGNADGYNHDAAIVTADGKTFALSIFSKGGYTAQIATITTLIQQYIRSH